MHTRQEVFTFKEIKAEQNRDFAPNFYIKDENMEEQKVSMQKVELVQKAL